jgi:hypothetical protein
MHRRYPSKLNRILGLALLIALLVACSGQRTVTGLGETPAPTSTPSEALRHDAQAYAEQFGISEGEALQRMQYQDAVGELQNALRTNEADTFGGLWIEHEPGFRVVVLFTRAGNRTIRPYIKERAFADLVEVRSTRYTLAELEAAYTQTVHELGKLDFGVSSMLNVKENRIEIPVSDRTWFESELRRAGAQLPEEVELVVVEGASTAKDRGLLLTPPVPGIAFPRQKPVEGIRTSMLALLIGTLWLDPEGSCLRITPLQGDEDLLPIWPPEYTLQIDGEQVLVLDGDGKVVARAGEEVTMGGGYVPVTDEWVLQQIPPACRGAYFVVGSGVRPNVPQDTELLNTDVLSTTESVVLFPRYTPALDEQVVDSELVSGKLVSYAYYRCLHLQTASWGPMTLAWPTAWSLDVQQGIVVVLDREGAEVARLGDKVTLRARPVPHSADVPVYRQLIAELPGDCIGATWLVDGIESVE